MKLHKFVCTDHTEYNCKVKGCGFTCYVPEAFVKKGDCCPSCHGDEYGGLVDTGETIEVEITSGNYGTTWFAFECPCGCVWDVRTSSLDLLPCPKCGLLTKWAAQWQADENGYNPARLALRLKGQGS